MGGCRPLWPAPLVKPSVKPDSSLYRKMWEDYRSNSPAHCDQGTAYWACRLFPKREIEQLWVGSSFFLQGTFLLALQLVKGGFFVSEHPAPPKDETRPSIWTSPWMELMRKHPDVALHVVPQWPFGASVPKPTGLLALRLPTFIASLYKQADRSLARPTEVR